MLALEGIKVLDFCRNTPGMFCTMVLGDLGADVLMVERPMTGDRAEYEESLFGVKSLEDEQRRAAYNALQRNKQSIALNLKEPEARDVFYRLAESEDVVVEGFRPGVVDRLGVGYQKISEINPRIVYCSISGYGQDSPYASMVGHDINYISLAGALGLIGHSEDRKPAIPLNLLADLRRWRTLRRSCCSGGPAGPAKNRAGPIPGHRDDRGCSLHAGRHDFRLVGPRHCPRPRDDHAERERSILQRVRNQGRQALHHRRHRTLVLAQPLHRLGPQRLGR